jgi:hypothetical protein
VAENKNDEKYHVWRADYANYQKGSRVRLRLRGLRKRGIIKSLHADMDNFGHALGGLKTGSGHRAQGKRYSGNSISI